MTPIKKFLSLIGIQFLLLSMFKILNMEIVIFLICNVIISISVFYFVYKYWDRPQKEFENLIPTLIEYAQGALDAPTLPMNTHWSKLGPLYVAVYNSASKAMELRKKKEEDNLKIAKLEGVVQLSQLVAHDLRQPLSLMRFLLSLPRESWSDEKLINEINSSLLIAEETLNDLLDFAAPTQPILQTVDGFELVKQVVELFRNHHRFSDLNIQNHQSKKIITEPKKFKRILQNLLSNALNYADGDTKILLEINESKEFTNFKISNQCVTLTPAIVSDFFKPLTSYQGGHGLGLVASQANAHRLGGDIVLNWDAPWVSLTFMNPTSVVSL